MAEAAPLHPVADLPKQAGGGASDSNRALKTVGPAILPHLRRVFESHAGPEKKWTQSQVKTFIHKVQEHSDTTSAAAAFLAHPELDLNALLAYMMSPDGAIGTSSTKEEDLSWPLASYFISSSHNTYLSGNQLSSDSTTDSYTNVLRRGCRCVEIDVWDGDESDSESSASGSSGDGGRLQRYKTKLPTKTKLARLRRNLPDAVTKRLERTKLVEKIEKRDVEKHGVEAATPAEEEEEKEANSAAPEVGLAEPRVLHGYTLTKEVSFRDVCVAIRESAFITTDLPVIVSLEVHCNPQQQALMVSIMQEAWAGYLVTDADEIPGGLPSPEQLKRKILVKVKYAAPDAVAEDNQSGGEDDQVANPAAKEKKPSKIIQALSVLGIYTRAVSFKNWAQPEATMASHIFSLSEKKFLDHQDKYGMDLFKHNKDYLMRAYPSGMRIGSSNLNPPVFWGYGAQVVALNWQQTDEGMMLNEGMFAGTGGYVLKPPGYRPAVKSKTSANTIIRKTANVTFTILAAQSIPLPHGHKPSRGFNPYLKIELHVDASTKQPGAGADNDGHEREGQYKARTRTHKGRDLDFQGEPLVFKDIPGLVEELTFVRFTVRDDEIGRDDLAAWACVRLDRLGQGYRFVHLMDSKGALTEGVVLLKVDKTLS